MSARREEAMAAFGRLLDIMDDLRAKCPWDREQTFESLRHLTVEETYELVDALAAGDLKETQKELGDLFLHLVFYAKLGSEVGAFDVVDVLEGIAAKLIHRHPHIYGDVRADDADAVKANWEAIKLKEGKKSVLEGVPKSLPALIKANRLQDKVKGVGFDWPHKAEVWAKVEEELGEFREIKQPIRKIRIIRGKTPLPTTPTSGRCATSPSKSSAVRWWASAETLESHLVFGNSERR